MPGRSSGDEQPSVVPAWLGAWLGVGGAAAFTQPAVSGSDLWWHLAAGREISASGAVPRLDSHSHTAAGEPWTNHEWLWDLLYWQTYAGHPEAIAWLNFAVVVAVLGLVFATARREGGSLLAAGATTWLVAAVSHWFLDIRPHLFSLLFVSLLLWSRDRVWAPWLWPPLVAVWANVHAGFVFGLGVIGLHVLGLSVRQSREAGRLVLPRPEWLGVALALCAALLNPWGWQILAYPLALLDSANPYRAINEWQPPSFELGWWSYAGRFWLAVGLSLPGALLARRRDPVLLGVVAVAFAMAVTSRRFAPLFCVVAAPLLARGFAAGQSALSARLPALRGRAAGWAAAGIALGISGVLWGGVRTQPEWLYRWTAGFFYPEAAVEYLEEVGGARHLLHLYSWGGYLQLAAPEVPVFIDGRALTVYSDALYRDYLALQDGAVGTRSLLAQYQVDAVLFPEGSGLVRRLRRGPEPWVEVYSDRTAVLLLPPDDPRLRQGLPSAQDVLGTHPDLLVRAGQRSADRGDFERAAERYEAALEANPLLIPVYGELASLAARRGATDAISQIIERGRRAGPRFESQLSELAGAAYERAGDLERAHAALLRARPASPFQTSLSWYEEIERLERRLAWRRSGFQGEEPR